MQWPTLIPNSLPITWWKEETFPASRFRSHCPKKDLNFSINDQRQILFRLEQMQQHMSGFAFSGQKCVNKQNTYRVASPPVVTGSALCGDSAFLGTVCIQHPGGKFNTTYPNQISFSVKTP